MRYRIGNIPDYLSSKFRDVRFMPKFDIRQAHSKITQVFLCGVSEGNQMILFL
jgi:hypothetical protein